MGTTAYTAQETLASSAYCYIDNANPATTNAAAKYVQSESFVDGAINIQVELSATGTTIDTDDVEPTDHIEAGDVLAFQASGGSSLGGELMLMTGHGVPAADDVTVERQYDGTTNMGVVSADSDIYKSRLDSEVTLCTFTVK